IIRVCIWGLFLYKIKYTSHTFIMRKYFPNVNISYMKKLLVIILLFMSFFAGGIFAQTNDQEASKKSTTDSIKQLPLELFNFLDGLTEYVPPAEESNDNTNSDPAVDEPTPMFPPDYQTPIASNSDAAQH